jgi:hypothetical protein|uniref:Uncharacterized protein n=1 Tax=Picea glauca TaxID=3330 RepID=A0A124GNV7_PICGL|nr:hypothetical protein ABT39_MTgene3230 [Picea glauca]QHR89272.1 hypothetical protein Q903MT_gene3293 [Picea sitchensis]
MRGEFNRKQRRKLIQLGGDATTKEAGATDADGAKGYPDAAKKQSILSPVPARLLIAMTLPVSI